MPETEALAARIDALEIRIAHQDRTIEELNGTITDQWKQIEDLAYRVSRLSDELRAVESSAGAGEEPEPPPPHY
jgi:SlyX protein